MILFLEGSEDRAVATKVRVNAILRLLHFVSYEHAVLWVNIEHHFLVGLSYKLNIYYYCFYS